MYLRRKELMQPKEISVYRIDYEIRDKDSGEAKLWSACIAGYTQEEALEYLGKFLGKTFKTIQFERRNRLDAITDPIRKVIIDGYLRETGQLKKDKKEEKKPKTRGKSIIKK